MLTRRRRRRANLNPALVQHLCLLGPGDCLLIIWFHVIRVYLAYPPPPSSAIPFCLPACSTIRRGHDYLMMAWRRVRWANTKPIMVSTSCVWRDVWVTYIGGHNVHKNEGFSHRLNPYKAVQLHLGVYIRHMAAIDPLNNSIISISNISPTFAHHQFISGTLLKCGGHFSGFVVEIALSHRHVEKRRFPH